MRRTERARWIKAPLRFVASVLMVSGLLLLADAGATLAWQEPISAFSAHREQKKLAKAVENPPKRVIERDPLPGDAVGRIVLPTLDRSYYVVEGTDTKSLRDGPGHYPDTPLPGERGTIGVAGHRTTHGAPFRTVDKLHRGDPIRMEMPYGTFVYTVERVKIVAANDLSVKKKVGYDRLMLSACHPLYSAAQRIIVFAKFQKRADAKVKGA